MIMVEFKSNKISILMALAKIQTFRSGAKTIAIPSLASGGGLFIFASIAILFLSSAKLEILNNAQMALYNISSPILSAASKPIQNASNFIQNTSGLATMKAENARLAQENAELSGLRLKFANISDENARLKGMLKIAPPAKKEYVTARVISNGGKVFSKTVIVNSGKNNGIQKGQIALGKNGMAGIVSSSNANASRVILISNINAKVPVIVGKSGINAIASGYDANSGKLEHLTSNKKNIKIGDHIVTSGADGDIPYGIPVGVVSGVSSDGILKVSFYQNMDEINYLKIIKTPQNEDVHSLLKEAGR